MGMFNVSDAAMSSNHAVKEDTPMPNLIDSIARAARSLARRRPAPLSNLPEPVPLNIPEGQVNTPLTPIMYEISVVPAQLNPFSICTSVVTDGFRGLNPFPPGFLLPPPPVPQSPPPPPPPPVLETGPWKIRVRKRLA